MRKSRILAYVLTACMTITMPLQAFAWEGANGYSGADNGEYVVTTVPSEDEAAAETIQSPDVTEGADASDAEVITGAAEADDKLSLTGTEAEGTTAEDLDASFIEADGTQDPELQDAETPATDDQAVEPQAVDAQDDLTPAGAYEGTASQNVYEAIVDMEGTVIMQGDLVPDDKTIIYIPEDAVRIANNAFTGKGQIKEIYFDKKSQVTAIGDEAFKNLDLDGVTIPSTVKNIGKRAFAGNRHLTTVSVNSLVLNLDSASPEIFMDSNIKEIHWNNNTKMVPDYLFYGAGFDSNFKLDFELPYKNIYNTNYITEVGTFAFYNSNLKAVDLTGVIEIDPSAFARGSENMTDSFETVTLPETLMYLGAKAFEYNTKLTTVIIESTKIQSNTEGGAFYQCKLQNVVWPNNIKTIPGGIFKNAYFDRTYDTTEFKYVPYVTMTIPATVKEIGADAFSMYDGTTYDFKKVVFEGDVPDIRTIGKSAFYNRTFTESINLNDCPFLKKIGAQAFYGVPLKGTLYLGGIVSIGDQAFYFDGNSFNDVYFGPYLTTMGKELFGDKTSKINRVFIYSAQMTSSFDTFSKAFKGHSAGKPEFIMNQESSLYKEYEKEGSALKDKVKMKSGAKPARKNKITYKMAGGKWGEEKGKEYYYADFPYAFEEPVLQGSKFLTWKLETRTGTYTEDDIRKGVYPFATGDFWTDDITLLAMYDQTPCYAEDIILRGTANEKLKPVVHGNTIIITEEMVKSKNIKDTEKIITCTAFPYDTFGDLMNTKQVKLTWKSSDTGVAKPKKVTESVFTNTFTLTGETGTANLTVVADAGLGGIKAESNPVTVIVRSKNPTLSYKSLEINKYEKRIWLPLVENEFEIVTEDRKGNRTKIVKETTDKGKTSYAESNELVIQQEGKSWYLSLKEKDLDKLEQKYSAETTMKNLYVSVVTRNGSTYKEPVLVGPFTLKITVTKPGVTISSTPSFKGNAFYADPQKAKVVYELGGSCRVTDVSVHAPEGSKYPCPWTSEVDDTGTSLTLIPEDIVNYSAWSNKDSWNTFMSYMKQKVELTITGVNSDFDEFTFKKTMTPVVPSVTTPKIAFDEITVFDYENPGQWYVKRQMVPRYPDSTIVDSTNHTLVYNYPIDPSKSDPNGITVDSTGVIDLRGTSKNYKSGSIKVRLISSAWTQPVDISQKISTSKNLRPDTLVLSSNNMKLSFDSLETQGSVTVGVRFKGSQEVPEQNEVEFVDSGKGTPDDEAIEALNYLDGELTIDCKKLKSIVEGEYKWNYAHTFKFKLRVPGSKKTVTYSFAVTKATTVSLKMTGNINILNRGLSYVLITPKFSGTKSDVFVESATLDQPITKSGESDDYNYLNFLIDVRKSDHKIMIQYQPWADEKLGTYKMSLWMDLSDGTTIAQNISIKTVQSQSGVQCEKSFKLSQDASGNAKTSFVIKEKKGTLFSRTYEIDRSPGGIEVLSFAKNANARSGYSEYLEYDAMNSMFVLTTPTEIDPFTGLPYEKIKPGTYKVKLGIHYVGEYLKDPDKPLTTITLTVTVRDSGN